jgi:hypothetical protein
VSKRVTVTPDPFTLIEYNAQDIAQIAEEAAAAAGIDPGVDIEIEVDEELFAPLVGHSTDVVDGVIKVWISGGNLEDNRKPRTFSADQTRRDLTIALLRGKDRLDSFATAPPDASLSRGERAAWEVFAVGRASALGAPVRHQAQLYEFRLQHGFTDVADAAFERLWNAPSMTWDGVREICKETGAADRPDSKIPVDLLRQK